MTFMGTSGEKHHSSFVVPPWDGCLIVLAIAASSLDPVPRSALGQEIAQVKKGVVKITAQVEGQPPKVGTGFIVRLEKDAAYIATASHVIEGDEIETVI